MVSETVTEKSPDRGDDVGIGADGTMTKKIDMQAEQVAIEYFTDHTDFSILSEERGLVEQSGDGYIIMDPVDGTNNAVMDIPFYCISLAFTRTDLSDVEVAFVKNLSTMKEYHALRGKGSFKDGSPIQRPSLGEERVFSLYLGKEAVKETFRIAKKAGRVRSLGSAALTICMVAEGNLDLYYHCTPDCKKSLRITDIAAAKLILEEVGGKIYDRSGDVLNMEIDPSMRENVIAIYDDSIKEEVL